MDPPIKPNESDCCNSCCNPCILDVYEDQLRKYQQQKLKPSTARTNCISPTSYTIFKLVNVETQSEETFLYTFEYVQPLRGCKTNREDLSLQYEPGQHFLLKSNAKGKEFTRAYTPIPINPSAPLQFTTLIKLYKDGEMSDYLKTIQIGSKTIWRGPYGNFKINYNHKFLFLVAQGTGIAPIYSVLYDMVKNEDCYTFLKLFYCCSNCDNIYLRKQLYNLSLNWNFTYEVFLSKSSDNLFERYNETIHIHKLELGDIQSYLSNKYESTSVLICGSENFNRCMKEYVLDCKIKEENVYTF